MIVASTSPQAPESVQRPTTPTKTDLDYNAFLQMLITSLQKQDPTSPSDPQQMLAQLASFSNVEQSIKINTKLDNLIGSSRVGDAGTLIGKTLTSSDGLVTGIVASVQLEPGGLIAKLQGGQTMAIDDGVRIGEP